MGFKSHTTTKLVHTFKLAVMVIILELELELFLRPTVSRPVRLGIGPPFGTLDQMLSCTSFFLFDNYVILISMRPL
jgi:hypothetical protein